MKPVLSALALAALLWPAAALSGPVRDFEQAYADMYASYRAALFMTNTGDAAASEKSHAALRMKWDSLGHDWAQTPPPHYADDPAWGLTLLGVAGLIDASGEQIAAGQLPQAHETLEGIRDALGDLHARNDIETFSDRMNAYHAEMEHVLAMDLAMIDRAAMVERAAVLDYLARDLLAAPPHGADGDPAFAEASAPFAASVAAFLAAARSGDPAAIRAAVAGLRKPYAKLFLKFG